MAASIEDRLRKLEQAVSKIKRTLPVELFIVPKGCVDVDAFEIRCRDKVKNRKFPLIIEFIGPEGGPELGTGFIDETD